MKITFLRKIYSDHSNYSIQAMFEKKLENHFHCLVTLIYERKSFEEIVLYNLNSIVKVFSI